MPPKFLTSDGSSDAQPVTEGVQVTSAVDSFGFEARDFGYPQAGTVRTNTHERFDLEAVGVESQVVNRRWRRCSEHQIGTESRGKYLGRPSGETG